MGGVLKTLAGGLSFAGGSVGKFALSAALIGTGAITGNLALVGAGLSQLASKPAVPQTQLSRLNITLEASALRKGALGTTAFQIDLRYHEGTGEDQEYIHYIIAHTAHRVKSIDQIYFEQELAWTATGGVTAKYQGYLDVIARPEGLPGNEINISSNWGSGESLTGCSYTYLRIKRTGNSKKSESPLVSGLPSRVTVIGNGGQVYDPRLDSTLPFGSGTHRADQQDTWGQFLVPADSDDNPALGLLTFLLGWTINGELSIGEGTPVERIDLESFATAANICDEAIALNAGGTQPRYRASATWSDGDDPDQVIATYLQAMNGTLRDSGGKLSLQILTNDLADYVLDLGDDDLLSGFSWKQTQGLTETPNVVRGRYVDPSPNSLYQLIPYPEVALSSVDGVPRVLPLDLAYVEDPRQAQRIAKQVLQRAQYGGTFTAEFSLRALGCEVGEVVRLTLGPLGWQNKLFRVVSKQINMEGRVPLTLIEEHPSIYAWDREEAAAVQAAAPTVYDPLNSPFILAAQEAGETAAWSGIEDDNGTKPENNATNTPAGDTNLVPFSLGEGDRGWVTTGQADDGSPVDYLDYDGYRFIGENYQNTAADQNGFVKSSLFSILPGQRYSVSAYLEARGENGGPNPSLWRLLLDLFDENQSYLGFIEIQAGTGAKNGVASGFATPPSGARFGQVVAGFRSAGAGAAKLTISRPMVSVASDSQTAHPAFVPGSNAQDGATEGAPAGTNVAGVEAAQLAADVATAEADATAALADLANYANDSVLTPLEKQRLRERRAEIVEEYDALLPRAQALGIAASTVSNFTAAYDAHINFLTAVGIDNPGNSVVVRADLIGGAEDYAFWLGAVRDAVTEKAAQLAEWDGITGSNKPDDNADVTAEATRTIDTQFADIEIRQFEAGNQGNRLIPFTAKRGGVSLDGGDWEVLQALLGPGSATINQSSGTLTLSGIVQSGTIELEYEHTDGVKTREQFTVRFVAQDPTVITITPSPSVPTWTKNQTTSLGVTHVAREGSTNLTGGTWALDATSPTITAGINATSGTVTVSNATANGSYTVRYTHTNGATEAKTVNVSVYEANDPGAPNDPNTSIP